MCGQSVANTPGNYKPLPAICFVDIDEPERPGLGDDDIAEMQRAEVDPPPVQARQEKFQRMQQIPIETALCSSSRSVCPASGR